VVGVRIYQTFFLIISIYYNKECHQAFKWYSIFEKMNAAKAECGMSFNQFETVIAFAF